MTQPVPPAGDETATLLGVLERNRRTFAWKCAGIDAAGFRSSTAASDMTLAGLMKHLALVEDHYFAHQLRGRPIPRPGTRSTSTWIRSGSGAPRSPTTPTTSAPSGSLRYAAPVP